MQHRGIRLNRLETVYHHRQIFVGDVYQFHAVFGDVTIVRHNDSHRFANKADGINCEAPLIDRCFQGNKERIGNSSYILAGDDSMDTGKRLGGRYVNGKDLRVRLG